VKLITNQQVSELVTTADAVQAMREAFAAAGSGAQQARVRTSASNGVMLSMMGAVIPDAGIAGAKVYTTIKGAFKFVITLFSTETAMRLFLRSLSFVSFPWISFCILVCSFPETCVAHAGPVDAAKVKAIAPVIASLFRFISM